MSSKEEIIEGVLVCFEEAKKSHLYGDEIKLNSMLKFLPEEQKSVVQMALEYISKSSDDRGKGGGEGKWPALSCKSFEKGLCAGEYSIYQLICARLMEQGNYLYDFKPKCHNISGRISKNLIRVAATRIFAVPERSFLELVLNSIDSYRRMDGENYSVGKFGMGFFSVLWWVLKGATMTMKSGYRGESQKICSWGMTIFKDNDGDIVFKCEKSNQKYTGTSTKFSDWGHAPYFFDGSRLRNTLLDIFYVKKISVLQRYPEGYSENLESKNIIRVTSKSHFPKNHVTVSDRATGIPLEVVFSSLLVPSISTKMIHPVQRVKGPVVRKSGLRSVDQDYTKDSYNYNLGVWTAAIHFMITVGDIIIINIVALDNIYALRGDADHGNIPRGTNMVVSLPLDTPLPVSRDDIVLEDPKIIDMMYEQLKILFLDAIKYKDGAVLLFKGLEKYAIFSGQPGVEHLIQRLRDEFYKNPGIIVVPEMIDAYNFLEELEDYRLIVDGSYSSRKTEEKLDDILKDRVNDKVFSLKKTVFFEGKKSTDVIADGGLVSFLFINTVISGTSEADIQNLSNVYTSSILVPWGGQPKATFSFAKEKLPREPFEKLMGVVNSQIIYFEKSGISSPDLKRWYERRYADYPEDVSSRFLLSSAGVWNNINFQTNTYGRKMRLMQPYSSKYMDYSTVEEQYGWKHYTTAIDSHKFVATRPTLEISKSLYAILDLDVSYMFLRINRILGQKGANEFLTDIRRGGIMWGMSERIIHTEFSQFITIKNAKHFQHTMYTILFDREIYVLYKMIFLNVVGLFFLRKIIEADRNYYKADTENEDNKEYNLSKSLLLLMKEIRLKIPESAIDDQLYIMFLRHNLFKISIYLPLVKIFEVYVDQSHRTDDYRLSSLPIDNYPYTFKGRRLIDYVFSKNIIPSDVKGWVEGVFAHKMTSPVKFQAIEIVVNEGTSKDFAKSVLTEMFQNSSDAIKGAGSGANKDISIEFGVYKPSFTAARPGSAKSEELVKSPSVSSVGSPSGTWTVGAWLSSLNLSAYEDNFVQDGRIHPEDVYDLTDEDLKELGIAKMAPRKRILRYAKKLSAGQLAIRVTDHIGIPPHGILSMMIPFLSSKSETDMSTTGEMGTGFFNVYRQPYVESVVIETTIPGTDDGIFIKGAPVIVDGRVIDLDYFFEFKKRETKGTTISLLLHWLTPQQHAELESDIYIFATQKLSLSTPLNFVRVVYNGVRYAKDARLVAQFSDVQIFVDPNLGFESYVLTNGVPFQKLMDFLSHLYGSSLRMLMPVSMGIILNILPGSFTPVQSRNRLGIDDWKKGVVKMQIINGLIKAYTVIVVENEAIRNTTPIIHNIRSRGSIDQIKPSTSRRGAPIDFVNVNFDHFSGLNKLIADRIDAYIHKFSPNEYKDSIYDRKAFFKFSKEEGPIGKLAEAWFENKRINLVVKAKPVKTVEVGATKAQHERLINAEKALIFARKYVDLFWGVCGILVQKGTLKGDFPFGTPSPEVEIVESIKGVSAFYSPGSHKITFPITSLIGTMVIISTITKKKEGLSTFINSNKVKFKQFFDIYCGGPYPGTMVHELEHAWRKDDHTTSKHDSIILDIGGAKKSYNFNEAGTKMFDLVVLEEPLFWEKLIQ